MININMNKVCFLMVMMMALQATGRNVSFCPPQCTCSQLPMIMQCTSSFNQVIQRVPNPLPSDVVQLILDENNIRRIEHGSITDKGESILSLSVRNNELIIIDNAALSPLTNLRLLNLKGNRLQLLTKEMFSGVRQLQLLDLDQNFIGIVDCLTFRQMPELQQIRLSQNMLHVITGCMLKGLHNLTALDLSNNHIKRIVFGAFDELDSLQYLRLNNNLIKTFSARWFLNKHMTTVQLSGNPWACSCRMQEEFMAVLYHSLDENCLSDNMCLVCNTPNRFQARIITNIVFSLPECTDETDRENNTSPGVRVINIRSLQDGSGDEDGVTASHITCEKSLCFSHNKQASTFQHSEIPSDVTALYLANNQFQRISASDFVGWYDLERLILTKNVINQVDDFSFRDQAKLEFAALDDNQLTHIKKDTFYGLTGLITLNLQKNIIKGVLKSGTFQFLDSLETLDLSDNLISELEECVFCNVSALRWLYLRNNQIITIHRDAFKGLLYLQTLDLVNNKVATFDFTAFNDNPFRISIQTNKNEWQCTCQLLQSFNDFLTVHDSTPSCGSSTDNLCVICQEPELLREEALHNLGESNFTDCPTTTVLSTTPFTMALLSTTTDKTTSPTTLLQTQTTLLHTTMTLVQKRTTTSNVTADNKEKPIFNTSMASGMTTLHQLQNSNDTIVDQTEETKAAFMSSYTSISSDNQNVNFNDKITQNLMLAIFLPMAVVLIIIIAVLIYIKFSEKEPEIKSPPPKFDKSTYSSGTSSSNVKGMQNGFVETNDIQMSTFN
ncbi:uncharacterized protein LOC143448660 isoform X1 [Clavelina lepadiformis]|uniref:uncharacterized protein LOC143448660 isoform X1 n=2 Tax=Clavelina lepadiformis TaxID=159417 RepID=UPI00404304AC